MQKTILSTADVARLFNVTETTVKRWADEGTLKCQKTPGGHRKFEIRNVIEFADKNNFEPAGALEFPEKDTLSSKTEVAVISRDFETLSKVFLDKALSPKKTELFLFLSYLYEHRVQLWEIYDLVIRAGMYEIGERWARGEIGVNHEHRASYETLDALAKLQTEILIKPLTGMSALFACVGGELHEIGLRCVSYLFESEGWSVHYLGANTPRDAAIAAVREMRPSVVSLSCTRVEQLQSSATAINELTAVAHGMGSSVIVGGAAAHRDAEELRMFDAVFRSTREVLKFIEDFGGKYESTR